MTRAQMIDEAVRRVRGLTRDTFVPMDLREDFWVAWARYWAPWIRDEFRKLNEAEKFRRSMMFPI